uniref:Uncharacterized protein n=1 Tax=Micrurus lemniscatus lemniscatus TaxID=129467 RepID=A0A2D4IP21_MICLE
MYIANGCGAVLELLKNCVEDWRYMIPSPLLRESCSILTLKASDPSLRALSQKGEGCDFISLHYSPFSSSKKAPYHRCQTHCVMLPSRDILPHFPHSQSWDGCGLPVTNLAHGATSLTPLLHTHLH